MKKLRKKIQLIYLNKSKKLSNQQKSTRRKLANYSQLKSQMMNTTKKKKIQLIYLNKSKKLSN